MWMTFERRWRDAVLSAMLPRSPTVPGYGDLDARVFWDRYPTVAPPLLKLGFRVAIWAVALWGFARHRASPTSISAADRGLLLADMAASRLYLVRQLAVVLKLIATMALFRDPQAREAADP